MIAKVGYSIYKYTLQPSWNLIKRYGEDWTVIVNAHEQSGQEFALELSKWGYLVCLIVDQNYDTSDLST